MRGTEEQAGLIRDKSGIYAGLVQSQSTGQQLAVCFRSDEKLFVRICLVKEVVSNEEGIRTILLIPETPDDTLTLDLHQIESIYPIHEYNR
jgi:hypothetical protein